MTFSKIFDFFNHISRPKKPQRQRQGKEKESSFQSQSKIVNYFSHNINAHQTFLALPINYNSLRSHETGIFPGGSISFRQVKQEIKQDYSQVGECSQKFLFTIVCFLLNMPKTTPCNPGKFIFLSYVKVSQNPKLWFSTDGNQGIGSSQKCFNKTETSIVHIIASSGKIKQNQLLHDCQGSTEQREDSRPIRQVKIFKKDN